MTPQDDEDLDMDEDEESVANETQREPLSTLLPGSLASLVSLAATTSSLSLRAAGFVGSTAIGLARNSTLTGFELTRVIFEGVFARAGRDISDTSLGTEAQLAANSYLERAISTLHRSITHTAFLVSAGFQIGSTSLTSSLSVAQFFLSALDAVLGDTQTSRAVAAIVSLVQREFDNPETGFHGERVGLTDVLVGTIAFSLLQKWGAKRTQQELLQAGVERTVWDIVVIMNDDDGTPEVEDDVDTEYDSPSRRRTTGNRVSFISTSGEAFDAVGDQVSFRTASSMDTASGIFGPGQSRSADAFKNNISTQLGRGAKVSLKAESLSQDTVTIDVEDGNKPHLEPPAGFMLVSTQQVSDDVVRFVFQRRRKRVREGGFQVGADDDEHSLTPPGLPALAIDNVTDDPARAMGDEGGDDPFIGPVRSASALSGPSNAPQLPESSRQQLEVPTPVVANEKRVRSSLASRTGSSGAVTGQSLLAPPSSYPVNTTDATGTDPSTPMRKAMRKGKSVRKLVNFWSRDQAQVPTRVDNAAPTFARSQISPNSHWPQAQRSLSDRAPTWTPLTEAALASSQAGRPQRQFRRRSSVYSIMSAVSDASERSMVLHSNTNILSLSAQLFRTGKLAGVFPDQPLCASLARFAGFAIASYGSTFMRLMNAWHDHETLPTVPDDLPQHQFFTTYTKLPSHSILLSSYVDPQGGSPASLDPDHGLPLVHYVSLDHDSKAVVLTCRGTLGFEDVLTDMVGDYDDIVWLDKTFKVHKGVYASARRLLTIRNGKVVATMKAALEKYPDYGLILCGHSLGGAVAAVLGVLLAQRNTKSAGGAFKFVTRKSNARQAIFTLPENRPIQVYAYGPAACFSPSLQQATRGLIVTVVHGQDFVPYLSLGHLRDVQAMALSFKTDSHNAKAEVVARVKDAIYQAIRDRSAAGGLEHMFREEWVQDETDDEDHWPWIALKSLRASMLADKLVPPGEVFTIESQQVLQRHAFVEASSKEHGTKFEARSFRPATHVKLVHVEDVETRYQELRFGASMFADHFPGRYEKVCQVLATGLGG